MVTTQGANGHVVADVMRGKEHVTVTDYPSMIRVDGERVLTFDFDEISKALGFDFDQSDAEDVRPDYLVHTVGFLVAEGPRFVSLAQEILPDGDGFRAVTHIPMSIVERIERLDIRA